MNREHQFHFKFSICGVGDLSNYCKLGITHVLSMLDPGFPEPDIFHSFGKHERLELRFHDIIDERAGMVAPQDVHVKRLLRFGQALTSHQASTAHLLVHCYAGLSRSTSAMVLLLAQARPDVAAADVIDQVVKTRPNAWPNLRILEIGDTVLGRRGELVSAAQRQYDRVVAVNPEFGRTLIAAGRIRELLRTQSAAQFFSVEVKDSPLHRSSGPPQGS
jgi:predicted protein tyrosine phosphatase